MLDIVSKGFMESTAGDQLRGQTSCRAYAFTKSVHSKSDVDAVATRDADVGTIELQIQRGQLGAPLPNSTSAFTGKVGKMKAMSDKAALTNGQSVGVTRSGRRITVPSTSFSHEISSVESMGHLTIRIFVRERRWLMSRRIIASNGDPCSEGMAASVLAVATSILEKRKNAPRKPAADDKGKGQKVSSGFPIET